MSSEGRQGRLSVLGPLVRRLGVAMTTTFEQCLVAAVVLACAAGGERWPLGLAVLTGTLAATLWLLLRVSR